MFLLILTFFDSAFAFPLTQHFMILQIQFSDSCERPTSAASTFFHLFDERDATPGWVFYQNIFFRHCPLAWKVCHVDIASTSNSTSHGPTSTVSPPEASPRRFWCILDWIFARYISCYWHTSIKFWSCRVHALNSLLSRNAIWVGLRGVQSPPMFRMTFSTSGSPPGRNEMHCLCFAPHSLLCYMNTNLFFPVSICPCTMECLHSCLHPCCTFHFISFLEPPVSE
jgi:hypothetical protein